MKRLTRHAVRAAVLVILAATAVSGCASTHMRDGVGPAFVDEPFPDLATVVFLRPSNFAFAIPAAVYDITDEPPALVGILSPDRRMAVAIPPGPHRFMVVSEVADFMDAELEGGKVYYALVTPRLGVRRARFSLQPLAATSPELDAYLRQTTWVETTPETLEWSRRRMAEIQAMKEEALGEWLADPGRPFLQASAGRTQGPSVAQPGAMVDEPTN